MGAGTLALAGLLSMMAALPPEIMPINDRQIKIPIVLAAQPTQVRELLLFVSSDQGRTWKQEAWATPDKEAFPFTAKDDGVYWFQVCTVFNNGRRDPADMNQLKPGLIVLIDTQPPVLKLAAADKIGDDVSIVWEVQEQYPELGTLRLEYRPAGNPSGVWQPVQITPALAGQVRFKPGVAGPLQVRMMVQDSAGNQAQAMQTVGGAIATVGASSPPAPPSTAPALPAPSGGIALSPPPMNIMAPPVDGPPPIKDVAPPPIKDVASLPRVDNYSNAPSNPPTRSQPPREPVREAVGGPAPLATSTSANGTATAPRQQLQNTQLINCTQISLDYEVPKVGPSGIKTVKLYMSRDDGRSWEELADNKDSRSPISANLPGEGVFGFRLVVESGAGLSKGGAAARRRTGIADRGRSVAAVPGALRPRP